MIDKINFVFGHEDFWRRYLGLCWVIYTSIKRFVFSQHMMFFMTLYTLGQCHLTTGICVCKKLVTGRSCNICKVGTYGLSNAKVDGCTKCDCNVKGTVSGDKTPKGIMINSSFYLGSNHSKTFTRPLNGEMHKNPDISLNAKSLTNTLISILKPEF